MGPQLSNLDRISSVVLSHKNTRGLNVHFVLFLCDTCALRTRTRELNVYHVIPVPYVLEHEN